MDDVEQEAAVGGRSPGITVRDLLSVYFISTDPIRWLTVKLWQLFCEILLFGIIVLLITTRKYM